MKNNLKFLTLLILIFLVACKEDTEELTDPNNDVPNVIEIDADGDGLIEIYYIEQLHAIRYDLDADGIVDDPNNEQLFLEAFPTINNMDNIAAAGTYTGYELKRNLDFKEASSYFSNVINTDYTTGLGWESIASDEYNKPGFRAQFDGNKFTISHLYGNGLFESFGGNVSIKNVGLIDVDIFSGWGFFGSTDYNLIMSNCFVKGGTIKGKVAVGLGYSVYDHINLDIQPSIIENCYTTCDLVSTSDTGFAAGLIGFFAGGSITNCYTTGNISGNNATGLVVTLGIGSGPIPFTSIKNCFTSGNITGENKAAGLVSRITKKAGVTDCFTSGNLTVTNAKQSLFSGTIAGVLEFPSRTLPYNSYIKNCYSTGYYTVVNADPYWNNNTVLVGKAFINMQNINDSFYELNTIGPNVIINTSSFGLSASLSASELKTPTSASGVFSNWGSDWDFGTSSDYPGLTINGEVFRPE